MRSPALAELEAVIFDWGGTLAEYATIELEDMWRLAARHLAIEHANGVSGASGTGAVEGRRRFEERELVARLAQVELDFWATTSTHQRAGTLADLLHAASEALELDVTEAVLEEAATHYLDAWTPHIRHEPDAADTLRALRRRGLRIGLLSNTHWPRAFHEHFLARDGLDELIDARLYTSELQMMKPHPEAFRAALAALDVRDPARAVFVGDRPFDDIHGARSSGLRAVLRTNPEVPPYDVTPDATIGPLFDLVAIVDGWRDAVP